MADDSQLPVLRVGTPLVGDYAHLARRMRPDEIAQWLALTGLAEYDPDLCARGFLSIPGPAWVLVGADNKPILLGGFEPMRAGVYRAWLLGTPEGWDAHWHAMTRICRRLCDGLFADGAHRIEVVALASRTEAHGWYEAGLRMTREGHHPGYFADGQAAVTYAITRTRGED